ncbi:hypothetical protein AMJ85_09985 [candidate division BRC1 bacterium SM23_51]|nr:MAG: hypothetical protein AMJ85_09985 [candidate division BRC1 bacterium SM23_51]
MDREEFEEKAANNRTMASDRPQPLKRLRWYLLPALIVAAIVGGAGLWLHQLLDGPVAKGDFEATIVVLPGTSYQTILEQLRGARLLPHRFVFDYLAWRRGDARRFRPGRYHLRSSMSAREVYDALIKGAPIRVTVPEGWTIEQIDTRLAEEDGLLGGRGMFSRYSTIPGFLARYNIQAPSAEGYILPETYFLDPCEPSGLILEEMLNAFQRRYAAEAQTSRPQSLTWHQVLTLASMIEREARNDDEKPLIASVYYNRLRRGMTLDCDATVRYALSKWREPLTRSDLKTESPYNTYLHKGLPPSPICTIGGRSLEAALSPAHSEFLYYCYKGDQSHHFSKTLTEHQRAVKKFLRKRLTPKPAKR